MIMMVMVMMACKFLLSAIYEENFQREEEIPQINVKTNSLIKEAGFDLSGKYESPSIPKNLIFKTLLL